MFTYTPEESNQLDDLFVRLNQLDSSPLSRSEKVLLVKVIAEQRQAATSFNAQNLKISYMENLSKDAEVRFKDLTTRNEALTLRVLDHYAGHALAGMVGAASWQRDSDKEDLLKDVFQTAVIAMNMRKAFVK